MKRAMLALALLLATVAMGVLVVDRPSVEAAFTKLQAQGCYSKYNGHGNGSGTDGKFTGELRRQYNKSNCRSSEGGNCSIGGSSRQLIVICEDPSPEDPADGPGNNAGISATCTSVNEVCVKNLPRTDTSGRFIRTALQVVVGIIAAISVLFVAIGGMRYVFSQGDPQAVSKAKSTIVYALIGLALAILGQGLVILVVNAIT